MEETAKPIQLSDLRNFTRRASGEVALKVELEDGSVKSIYGVRQVHKINGDDLIFEIKEN